MSKYTKICYEDSLAFSLPHDSKAVDATSPLAGLLSSTHSHQGVGLQKSAPLKQGY